ncbi:methyl-accepting chemotaxis protein [Brevibacillus fluminis]|uniref:methyl-accepting chemotaxis protein n=1 Tax=Brevibacillus fluminis TaxID=511487 RepID=UPI003F891F12
MGRFANLSLVKKMIAAFVIVSLVWSAICAGTIAYMLQMKAAYAELLQQDAAAALAAEEIQYQVATQNHALVAYLVAVGAGAVTDQQSIQAMQKANSRIAELGQKTLGLVRNGDDRETLSQIIESNRRYREKAEEVIRAVEQESNRKRAEVIMQTEVVNLSALMIARAAEVAGKQQAAMNEKEQQNTEKTAHLIQTVIMSGAAAMFLAIAASYAAAKKMTRPLIKMVDQTERIASGNLNMEQWEQTTGDEIGRLSRHFQEMAHQLRGCIEQIAASSDSIGGSAVHWQASAEHTTAASRSIAQIMQQVQAAIMEQMQQVEQTARLAVEMSAGIGQINQSAHHTASRAEQMLQLSRKGTEEMKSMDKQMAQIRQSVRQLQTQFLELRAKNDNIGKIVGFILDIAKQTNMLALNASIEAQRAGMHGRGFSVIAEHIRQLSIQTGQSAAQIQTFVGEIAIGSDQTTASMENSMREVERGIAAVLQAEQSFAAIGQALESYHGQMQEVASASSSIEGMTGQVAAAIERINAISQTTSAQTQEVTAATEEQLASMEEILHAAKGLTALAGDLQQAISRFRWS